MLANIYLHYVLDMWFEHVVCKECKGKAFLVRYADDFVVCFDRKDDATTFMHQLKERLGRFGLETEPSKTKILRFGPWADADNKAEGKKNQTFDFLGFTHYLGKSARGKFLLGRKTQRKRARRKLLEVSEKLRNLRVAGAAKMYTYTRQHLEGHYQYYGIRGNYPAISSYAYAVRRILFKWINRRSQRKSISWARFGPLLNQGLLPKPRICHNLYNFFPNKNTE